MSRLSLPDIIQIPDVVYMEAMIASTAELRQINREIRESMAAFDKEINALLEGDQQ